MTTTTMLSPSDLRLDADATVARLSKAIRERVHGTMRKRGMVVALSGGIDSSVTAALAVAALGPERVFGLLMPEAESSDDTLGLSRSLAEHLGIEYTHEDITELLAAAGCYRRRDEAFRMVIPEYGPGWKAKIVLPDITERATYNVFSVVAETPEGERIRRRLTPAAYLQVVAATNFKQRVRKMLEYYHADRLNYAVAGTPNRLEYDQGFFVKGGDGLADIKPIAHLYKTQVFQLADHFELPEAIRTRTPTTDTYSLPQDQDEFYFALPYKAMDLCLYGYNQGMTTEQVAPAVDLTPEQVERVYQDIDSKRRATRYLHLPAQLIGAVPEIDAHDPHDA